MAKSRFSFTVFGVVPATQGSKKYVGTRRTASGNNIPLIVESHPGLPKFRSAVADAVVEAIAAHDDFVMFTGAVKVIATFYLPKPASSRAEYPINQRSGDLDKYLRALLDSITKGGAWTDDSLVVEVEAYKLYATGDSGVAVTIETL